LDSSNWGAAMKLEQLVDALREQHIFVIGDAIDDTYIFGRCDRLCPEAPVPVFTAERTEERQGGAAHTAQQVEVLGKMSALFGWPKSVKLRYIAGSHMLMRFDADEKPSLTSQETIEAFERATKDESRYDKIDGIVLSDYGKGLLDETLCQYFIGYAKRRKIPVVVDPKGSEWHKYRGADWICPNEKEWGAAPASFTGAKVLQKRGSQGLRIDGTDFPSTARAVFDVTGAGDTVVAVFAMAICAGADPGTAAQLANIAAGWTVGQVGTVSISHDMLKWLAKLYDAEIATKQAAGRKLN
jgi:bifunctional ADP-heptose synthase (sugar kinase/adenylyltransferase)